MWVRLGWLLLATLFEDDVGSWRSRRRPMSGIVMGREPTAARGER
jgi:hypothetical protein